MQQIIPKEEQDQEALAQLLDSLRLLWTHVPNETKAKPQYLAKRKRLGVKSGFPDVIIFNPPPCNRTAKGAAVELKRAIGGKVSPEQTKWLKNLAELGWVTAICFGIDDVIKQLRAWGYF